MLVLQELVIKRLTRLKTAKALQAGVSLLADDEVIVDARRHRCGKCGIL